ncbi:hypothetical protein AMELA_G00119790, partial [Ameiurus melas]
CCRLFCPPLQAPLVPELSETGEQSAEREGGGKTEREREREREKWSECSSPLCSLLQS